MTGAIASILDDYHQAASIETFTVTKSEQHPTDLAGLVGARLVTANETEEGRRWSESRVKQLTGEDLVRARFMRQDFFTYKPQFKLMFNGNHMPALRTVNKAITRRFNRIPFLVVIADEDVDKQLDKKLKKEWPGILAWTIKGCLQRQELGGLNPPAIVTEATESYLENEDILGEWIKECCELDAQAWSSSTDLFTSWKYWAAEREEWVGAVKNFSQRLEDRGGFKPCKNKDKTKRGFRGLRLKEGQKKDPVHRIVPTPVEQPTEEERKHGRRAHF
jgi:putative DNA primase/helicase